MTLPNLATVSLEASSTTAMHCSLYGTSAITLPNYSAHGITWRVWSVTTKTVQRTLLHQLYWLRVEHRIEHKLAVICYKAFLTGQPEYLAAMLISCKPGRLLRSNAMDLLHVPSHKIEMAARRFSCVARASGANSHSPFV